MPTPRYIILSSAVIIVFYLYGPLTEYPTQAVGVQGTENGAVTVTTKKPSNPQQPGKNEVTVTYGPKTATRK